VTPQFVHENAGACYNLHVSTTPTRVFVHGNPEVAAIWSQLVAELEKRGVDDIVLLSPPGFGAPVPDGWVGDVDAYRHWLIDELERISGTGAVIDLVGHDWGAGHVFGTVAARPDLVRSFAADCVGLLHPDYVWHDMAQAWQTPEVGEQVVDGMIGAPRADLIAMFTSFGAPGDIAAAMAEAADADMGRCILTLYRSAAQPATAAIGQQLREVQERPPMLAIIASEDPYVSAAQGVMVAEQLGAERLPLDGCGHWWMFEEPAAAASGLVAFWSSLD
jgi:pimeloyl-ACP methyl ester carboxylesterase